MFIGLQVVVVYQGFDDKQGRGVSLFK